MESYFKIYRKVFAEDFLDTKPYDEFHAWIWLIGHANYQSGSVIKHSKKIKLRRGQLYTSKAFLSKQFGWNHKKTDRFLRDLEVRGMVKIESNTMGTTLTIEKYNKYQGDGVDDGGTYNKKNKIRDAHDASKSASVRFDGGIMPL